MEKRKKNESDDEFKARFIESFEIRRAAAACIFLKDFFKLYKENEISPKTKFYDSKTRRFYMRCICCFARRDPAIYSPTAVDKRLTRLKSSFIRITSLTLSFGAGRWPFHGSLVQP